VEGGHGGYSCIAAEKSCHPRCIEGKAALGEQAIFRVKGASAEGIQIRYVHLLRLCGAGGNECCFIHAGDKEDEDKIGLALARLRSEPVAVCCGDRLGFRSEPKGNVV